MADLGLLAEEFGLHSLKAGGATTAANAKVLDRCFKRHGRWKSENAKDGYIKDNLDGRLEVSKSLGLYFVVNTKPPLWTLSSCIKSQLTVVAQHNGIVYE